jgi:hypothetical protein
LESDLMNFSMELKGGNSFPRIWSREQFQYGTNALPNRLLRIDLPLVNGGDRSFGTLRLIKDLREEPIDYFTLRRVESLRRTIVEAMDKMAKTELMGERTADKDLRREISHKRSQDRENWRT